MRHAVIAPRGDARGLNRRVGEGAERAHRHLEHGVKTPSGPFTYRIEFACLIGRPCGDDGFKCGRARVWCSASLRDIRSSDPRDVIAIVVILSTVRRQVYGVLAPGALATSSDRTRGRRSIVTSAVGSGRLRRGRFRRKPNRAAAASSGGQVGACWPRAPDARSDRQNAATRRRRKRSISRHDTGTRHLSPSSTGLGLARGGTRLDPDRLGAGRVKGSCRKMGGKTDL